jgi:enhancer of polycomb-like protein
LDNALANDFTYYMDERDLEWLEKNNQEATGEGTSAQGALSTGSTRSARSAKSKGKEPESNQPVAITEDEFELVMGILEKVTHEKTEFLHHVRRRARLSALDADGTFHQSLETGMTFPAFSEYQDTFSKPLEHTLFATLVVPDWVPESAKLLRIAKAIYPHWKERRIDRGGRRIMPALNVSFSIPYLTLTHLFQFDESDTLNESYVCFRRRDVKAVRKTRASQATPFDKFYRLSTELAVALDIAQATESREPLKKECFQQDRDLFEKRLAFVECKRKVSPPGDKNDDDLIFDKERTRKKLPKYVRLTSTFTRV